MSLKAQDRTCFIQVRDGRCHLDFRARVWCQAEAHMDILLWYKTVYDHIIINHDCSFLVLKAVKWFSSVLLHTCLDTLSHYVHIIEYSGHPDSIVTPPKTRMSGGNMNSVNRIKKNLIWSRSLVHELYCRLEFLSESSWPIKMTLKTWMLDAIYGDINT